MTIRPRPGLVSVAVAFACAAVLGVFVWSSLADAHTLSKDRARQASFKGIQKHCRQDPYCTNYGVGKCRRPAGSGHQRLHRMRCKVFLEGKDKVGYWRCSWTDQWYIKAGSRKLWWNQKVYNKTFRCIR